MAANPVSGIVPTAILAAGIALAGWWIGDGFIESRRGDRVVAVKGLAERNVVADTAIWSLRFVTSGDDLDTVRAGINRNEHSVRQFLARHGLNDGTIRARTLDVRDLRADPYRSGPIESRFIVAMTLTVRSPDVSLVEDAAAAMPELLAEDVVIASDMGPQSSQPIYLFTRLNDLKPELIAEATANARAAALQFAGDSGSTVGPIIHANQGIIQILPRDNAPGLSADNQIDKILRVVSTVNYRLVD
ncbi:MAG: SIMPL domain-containing protein [Geminicoccaceae bacterium]|nr:SIMPL domain-containing protein [Geminicoccaceae bacterium]